MNQRIRELAEQAHCYACEYAQQPDYNPHNPYNQLMYKQRYDSKFAELIVRECIQRLIDHSPARFTNEVAEEEWDKGYDQAMEDSVNHIKEHFGVEQ